MEVYKLAIVTDGCSNENKEICFQHLISSNCNFFKRKCFFPIKINPICSCDKVTNCPRLFEVIKSDKKDKKSYIFYKCKKCSYLIKDNNSILKNFVTNLGRKDIIIGKELDDHESSQFVNLNVALYI